MPEVQPGAIAWEGKERNQQRTSRLNRLDKGAVKKINKPYEIENVIGAPLLSPKVLCGTLFEGLRVYRHRQFESNMPLFAPPPALISTIPKAPGTA